MTTLVWLRRDLRLQDNPALHAAFKYVESVVPVFIYSPEEENPWAPGSASRWYLHHSLIALQQTFQSQGMRLAVASGSSLDELLLLAKRSGVKRILWNRVYEPAYIERDARVADALKAAGLEVKIFHDQSLLPPGSIKNVSGKPYRVFTPFWRRLASILLDKPVGEGLYPKPGSDFQLDAKIQPDIARLGLLDDHPWYQKLALHWQAGEIAAVKQLQSFVKKLNHYAEKRDFPADDATSCLSAALHFGELSPWRIIDSLRPAYEGEWGEEAAKNAESIMRQLGWREFAINLLHMAPDSPTQSLQRKFEGSGIWFYDSEHIKQWQQGKTGFALVDAGMSELWETGWMHNRVRMVVASMLTKNLGQHWIHGVRWFWDTLVDADLANNTMGWQWVAGCGCDAAPYYRVFNPEIQAKRFDPDGVYISRWLDSTQLSTPIINLATSREAALARHAELSRTNVQ